MTVVPWEAYQQAVVQIDLPAGRIRVEPAPVATFGRFPFDEGDVVTVVTAFVSSDGQSERNVARHVRLLAAVSALGLRWWSAEGGDPLWVHREISVAVAGLSEQTAIDLGRRFDQDAIFRWSAENFALVSCIDDAVWHRGWTVRSMPTSGGG